MDARNAFSLGSCVYRICSVFRVLAARLLRSCNIAYRAILDNALASSRIPIRALRNPPIPPFSRLLAHVRPELGVLRSCVMVLYFRYCALRHRSNLCWIFILGSLSCAVPLCAVDRILPMPLRPSVYLAVRVLALWVLLVGFCFLFPRRNVRRQWTGILFLSLFLFRPFPTDRPQVARSTSPAGNPALCSRVPYSSLRGELTELFDN